MANNAFDDMIASTAKALKIFGDELREKANSAGKDAQEAWQRAKPQLEEVEARVKDGVETLKQKAEEEGWREQVEVATVEAKERWAEFEPRVAPIIEGIAAAGAALGKAVDGAIAGTRDAVAPDTGDDTMTTSADAPRTGDNDDATDRVKARAAANQERIRDELNKAGKSLEGAAVAALDEMQGAIGRLRDKLGKK